MSCAGKAPAVSDDPIPSLSAPAEGSSGGIDKSLVSYVSTEFIHKYHGFRLLAPIWGPYDYKSGDYYIARGPGKTDEAAVVGICPYDADFDAEDYDLTSAETLEEVFQVMRGKIDFLLQLQYSSTPVSDDCVTEVVTVAGLDGLKFFGDFVFDTPDGERARPIGGYCIQGASRPVVLFVADLSSDGHQAEDLASMMDEMAATFVDGE